MYEICWTIAGVNNYCDITRTFNTNKAGTAVCLAKVAKSGLSEAEISEVSSVYDFPILISTIYHMIEWLRWALLGTIALVDANLVPIFYFLHLNVIFGFFALLISVIGGFTADAGCAEV